MSNTISQKDFSAIVGNHIVSGLSPDGVRINPPKDFEGVAGVGSITRKRLTNTYTTVEIEILRTSGTNEVFRGMHAEDLATNNARFSILLVDNLTGEKYEGSNCFFTGVPPAEFSEGNETRVWEILVPELDFPKAAE